MVASPRSEALWKRLKPLPILKPTEAKELRASVFQRMSTTKQSLKSWQSQLRNWPTTASSNYANCSRWFFIFWNEGPAKLLTLLIPQLFCQKSGPCGLFTQADHFQQFQRVGRFGNSRLHAVIESHLTFAIDIGKLLAEVNRLTRGF